MTISERVAYIRGLYDGLGLDASKSGEARVLSEMLDVLKQIGVQVDGADTSLDRLYEELDDLRDSVSDLENAVFDEDGGDFEDDGDTDEDFFEIPCPTCGEDLVVDDDALAAGVVDCPACGGKFALSFEDEKDAGREE